MVIITPDAAQAIGLGAGTGTPTLKPFVITGTVIFFDGHRLFGLTGTVIFLTGTVIALS